MSETTLLQPRSSTASLDTAALQKMHYSMDLLGKSGLQSLRDVDYIFRDHTSIKFPIATEKALAYGNVYNSFCKSISSFFNIGEEDFSSQVNPINFDEIKWGTYKFQLSSQLEVNINFADELWEAENKELDMFLVADDIEELKSNFQEEFFVMWQVYSQEPDEKLTTKAKQIKENLLSLVTGVVVDCD